MRGGFFCVRAVCIEVHLVSSSHQLIFVIETRRTNAHCASLFKVLPDYLKALLSVVPQGKPSEQHLQQITRLAALQHRAKDTIYLPTL